MDKVNFNEFDQLRGHKSEVSWAIGSVIELDRDIMPISIVTKFGEDRVSIAQVRKRTKSISTNFTKKGRNPEVH